MIVLLNKFHIFQKVNMPLLFAHCATTHKLLDILLPFIVALNVPKKLFFFLFNYQWCSNRSKISTNLNWWSFLVFRKITFSKVISEQLYFSCTEEKRKDKQKMFFLIEKQKKSEKIHWTIVQNHLTQPNTHNFHAIKVKELIKHKFFKGKKK